MAGASVRRTALRSLALLSLTTALGCGVDDQRHTPPLGQGGSGGQSAASGIVGGCAEGATRDCHVTLAQHGSVLTCYDGTETCSNGRWGACTDGTVKNYKAPADSAAKDPQGGVTQLTMSDAGPCMNNPCDPTCMVFDEMPIGGGVVSLTPWGAGSLVGLSNIPGGILKKGLQTPCGKASDCQFNEHCDNPVSGTCSHHKCAPGGPLDASCDPCVASICAADPSCCVTAPACLSHDVCVQGGPLTKACGDPCVAAVCAADAACCTSSWDATCVGLVASTCNKTCPAWSQSCVDKVHDVCGAFCGNSTPACTHDKCFTGAPLSAACDGSCVAAICAANPSCCTSSWDAGCVAQVNSICALTCPTQGLCNPWIPGTTDPKCAGPDLTIGIPCGAATIPVCNVGTQTAPAGISVLAYPANGGFTNGVNICTIGPNPTDCGTTPQPIPPGGCVDIMCAGLNANNEIIVNPPGAGHVSECQCQNNWAIFPSSNISCEPLSCAGAQPGSVSAMPNMLISVERSNAVSAATWSAMQAGLNNFFKTNTAATNGLGLGLGFYPDKNAGPKWDCNTTTCDQSQCRLRVDLSQMLTTAAGDPAETTLVNAVNAKATVDPNPAPTGAALQSALGLSSAYLSSNTQQSVVVVLIMASEPSTCNPPSPPPASLSTPSVLAGLASTQFATYGIKTFVIGVGPSVSWSTISLIATAGGGQAYAVKADANLAQNLTNALLAIRGQIFSCTFPLPPAGTFDPTSIGVKYLPGGQSMSQLLPKYSDAVACGANDGFYLDNNASPTKVILCPATCTAVNTYDPAWGAYLPFVKLVVNCPAAVTKQVYTDNCPAGTKVQWGFLGWDTTDPAGTSVLWQARTADTSALLPMASFYGLGTAQSSPTNTQVCPIGSACAVDLFKKLNGPPDVNRDYLELSITLNQNLAMGMTPSVNNWKITYSCPPSE